MTCIPKKQLGSRRPWKGSQDVRWKQPRFELANWTFAVDRPFTLLVQWIKDTGNNSGKLIDVGGGSGHIVLGLAKVRSFPHLRDLGTHNFHRSSQLGVLWCKTCTIICSQRL